MNKEKSFIQKYIEFLKKANLEEIRASIKNKRRQIKIVAGALTLSIALFLSGCVQIDWNNRDSIDTPDTTLPGINQVTKPPVGGGVTTPADTTIYTPSEDLAPGTEAPIDSTNTTAPIVTPAPFDTGVVPNVPGNSGNVGQEKPNTNAPIVTTAPAQTTVPQTTVAQTTAPVPVTDPTAYLDSIVSALNVKLNAHFDETKVRVSSRPTNLSLESITADANVVKVVLRGYRSSKSYLYMVDLASPSASSVQMTLNTLQTSGYTQANMQAFVDATIKAISNGSLSLNITYPVGISQTAIRSKLGLSQNQYAILYYENVKPQTKNGAYVYTVKVMVFNDAISTKFEIREEEIALSSQVSTTDALANAIADHFNGVSQTSGLTK